MLKDKTVQKYDAIYLVVSMIPIGCVTSYGRISAMIPGTSARLVARAMTLIPEGSTIPWHRVVSSTLKIADFPGSDRQRELLIEEGVAVSNGLKINPSHLWQPGQ